MSRVGRNMMNSIVRICSPRFSARRTGFGIVCAAARHAQAMGWVTTKRVWFATGRPVGVKTTWAIC